MQDRPTFRHAVKWAFVMTTGQRGIGILLTFVLAAMLGPSDFGLIAMAGAYIIFVEMFVAQGMGAAIIQRKDLKDEHLDSIFWLILSGSVVLALISIAISPWWAAVNDLPRLATVISVLSILIPIKGLTVVQNALLQRKMDFRNLALLTGAASIIGGVVGVAMALSGYGVWSLVAQQLVGSVLATAIMWKVSSWRPRLRFSYRRVRELFGFSNGVFVSHLGVYTAGQSDAILMGVFFGPIAVGLYRLADRIMDMFLEVATRSIQVVSLPQFASLQDDPPKLRASLLSCIRLSTAITIPGMTILAVSSDQLMALIDAKWAPAASVLQIVVFMGMAKSVTLFCGPVLLAQGRSKTVAALVWTLAILTTGLIAIVSMTLATADVLQQITAVALSRTGLFIVIYGTATLIVTNRLCGIPLRQLGAAIRPGISAACVVLLLGTIISSSAIPTSDGSFIALLWIVIPAAVAAGTTLVATDKEIRQFLLSALRSLRLGQAQTPRGTVAVRDD